MRVLLDTHIFLWLNTEPERLGSLIDVVADPANQPMLSAGSAWEIAIKVALGRLELPDAADEYVPSRVRAAGVAPLPITHAHALAVSRLPRFDDHRDPFDRLLAATARTERVALLSADRVFERYDVELLRP